MKWQRLIAGPMVFAGVMVVMGCGSGTSGGSAVAPPESATASAPATEGAGVAETEAAATEPGEVAGSDFRPMSELARDGEGVRVTTEDLEQGRVGLKSVKAAWLMPLLEDLKARRADDRAEHHGARGPNGEFLDGWIRKIAEELQRRGYAVDNEGNALAGG